MLPRKIIPLLKVSILFIVAVVFAALIGELGIEYTYDRSQEKEAQRVEPFYFWAFYTSSRVRISKRKEPLG